MRQASRYSIGATPTARLTRSKNTERESAASFAGAGRSHRQRVERCRIADDELGSSVPLSLAVQPRLCGVQDGAQRHHAGLRDRAGAVRDKGQRRHAGVHQDESQRIRGDGDASRRAPPRRCASRCSARTARPARSRTPRPERSPGELAANEPQKTDCVMSPYAAGSRSSRAECPPTTSAPCTGRVPAHVVDGRLRRKRYAADAEPDAIAGANDRERLHPAGRRLEERLGVRRRAWSSSSEASACAGSTRTRSAHVIVADSPDATDFRKTSELPRGGEQSFVLNKLGTTRIHCELHPNMTGTLIVRER